MLAEFAKYNVLPLDASVATRLVTPRPSVTAGRKVFNYSGEPVTGIPGGAAPSLLNTSYTITAEIDVPQGGAEGMISHRRWTLRRLRAVPAEGQAGVHLEPARSQARALGRTGRAAARQAHARVTTSSTTAWASRRWLSTISAASAAAAPACSRSTARWSRRRRWSARCRSSCNGTRRSTSATDTGTPVDDRDYQVPFKFTGKIDKLTIAIDRPRLTPEDEKRLEDAARSAADEPTR